MAKAGSPQGEYKAEEYWSERLGRDFSLAGVGYLSWGESFNYWQYRAYLRNLQRAERRFGFDLSKDSILECGFGTGFFLDYYHQRGNDSFAGVDLTEVSVNSLRRKYPQADLRQADLGGAPLDMGKQFDIVTAFAVLLHITDDVAFAQAVANLCNQSRDYVLISDMFPRERFQHAAASHNVLRSYAEYETELAKHGFTVVGTEPIFVLLSAPQPRVKWWFYTWSGVLHTLTRLDWTAKATGATLYGVDGLLIRTLGLEPSIRLLVARRNS